MNRNGVFQKDNWGEHRSPIFFICLGAAAHTSYTTMFSTSLSNIYEYPYTIKKINDLRLGTYRICDSLSVKHSCTTDTSC
ncbi:18075_t:CDS:2 [Acaulospora morrowiae]|uniref:18075_t:CDS:1 n=1 Tax=Acaulospora morrowiae TaxID=94023 RepID=A0A9N9AK93_9GLOM|nr:18075_t:CDS:2 [Acaulospora morrowiae]